MSRMAKWMNDWDAQTDLERRLVARAVRSSWLLERAEAIDEARVLKNMRAAATKAEDRAAAEVAELTAQLAASPAATIRRLRSTPAGCFWIREQLTGLSDYLDRSLQFLDSQRELACFLVGRRIQDVLRDDTRVTPWVIAMLGAAYGDGRAVPAAIAADLGGKPAGMDDEEFSTRIEELIADLPGQADARALLNEYLAEALGELDAHLRKGRRGSREEARAGCGDGRGRPFAHGKGPAGPYHRLWSLPRPGHEPAGKAEDPSSARAGPQAGAGPRS